MSAVESSKVEIRPRLTLQHSTTR